jgi:peptidoglycan/xylan/chitin deacetylase (PgdA/CDA1 family)
MAYSRKVPALVRPLMGELTWNIKDSRNTVYLTFDDGPHTEITTEVMQILDDYQALATFFLVGRRAAENPQMVNQLLDKGHSIGNHTYTHVNGWKTNNFAYCRNVLQAEKAMPATRLFRPPYGRITRSQSKILLKRYQIIMWDVLSGDFDVKSSASRCAQAVIRNCKSGSIVVFHDSEKAYSRMIPSLKQSLQYLSDKGYSFLPIPGGQKSNL